MIAVVMGFIAGSVIKYRRNKCLTVYTMDGCRHVEILMRVVV